MTICPPAYTSPGVFRKIRSISPLTVPAPAAAWVLEVPAEEIAAGLAEFRPCPGRMELVELPGDLLLLEDSYNANPLSMRAALDALDDLGRPGRRIAVLGDMLELGAAARDLHFEVGQTAARLGIEEGDAIEIAARLGGQRAPARERRVRIRDGLGESGAVGSGDPA